MRVQDVNSAGRTVSEPTILRNQGHADVLLLPP